MNLLDFKITDLPRHAERMVAFAHDRSHYCDPTKGENPQATYPAHLTLRVKPPNAGSQLLLCYSVDVVDGKAHRHLSVQWSEPGSVTQRDLVETSAPGLELLTPIVRMFFSEDTRVSYSCRALAPVPLVDATVSPSERNVTFRTPVVFHFLADHEVVDEVVAARAPSLRRTAFTVVEVSLNATVTRIMAGLDLPGLGPAERAALRQEIHAIQRWLYAAGEDARAWEGAPHVFEVTSDPLPDDGNDTVPHSTLFCVRCGALRSAPWHLES